MKEAGNVEILKESSFVRQVQEALSTDNSSLHMTALRALSAVPAAELLQALEQQPRLLVDLVFKVCSKDKDAISIGCGLILSLCKSKEYKMVFVEVYKENTLTNLIAKLLSLSTILKHEATCMAFFNFLRHLIGVHQETLTFCAIWDQFYITLFRSITRFQKERDMMPIFIEIIAIMAEKADAFRNKACEFGAAEILIMELNEHIFEEDYVLLVLRAIRTLCLKDHRGNQMLLGSEEKLFSFIDHIELYQSNIRMLKHLSVTMCCLVNGSKENQEVLHIEGLIHMLLDITKLTKTSMDLYHIDIEQQRRTNSILSIVIKEKEAALISLLLLTSFAARLGSVDEISAMPLSWQDLYNDLASFYDNVASASNMTRNVCRYAALSRGVFRGESSGAVALETVFDLELAVLASSSNEAEGEHGDRGKKGWGMFKGKLAKLFSRGNM